LGSMTRVLRQERDPEEMPVRISIFEFAGGPDAIGGVGETAIHDRIAKALRRGQSVVLSYAGMQIISWAFLNDAIGELCGEFDEALIREKIRVEDATPGELATFNGVIEHAVDYFRDPERYTA